MQRIIITGNCGRDPETRQTQDGTDICSFSAGVKQGWGEKASTNWFSCSVWGKRARTVGEHLRKGTKVTVIGELTIGEYQGKTQYEVRVDDVDWTPVGQRDQSDSAARTHDASGGWNATAADHLDDDVPF